MHGWRNTVITELSLLSAPCVETLANTVHLLGGKIQQLGALQNLCPDRHVLLFFSLSQNRYQ